MKLACSSESHYLKICLSFQVCLNKLDDLQLAIMITRLYESELGDVMPENLRRILYEECLGCDRNGENYDPSNVHPDAFIRSMGNWMMKDYSASLGTLLETNVGQAREFESKEDENMSKYSSNPSVFNFYNYLRTHPLLMRQNLAASAADKSKSMFLSGFSKTAPTGAAAEMSVTYVDQITPIERRLYFMTAHAHFKAGCPMLALEVLCKLPEVIDLDSDITKSRSADSVSQHSEIQSGILEEGINKAGDMSSSNNQTADSMDWSQPVINTTNQTADSFDWSKPVTSNIGQTSDAFDWSQPVSKFDDEPLDLGFEDKDPDEQDTKSDSEVESKDKLLKNQSVEQRDEGIAPDGHKKNHVGDVMAHQLKYIACLKIMMEELSTLATGFEVDGGRLRYQLYIWLEKEVECLQRICGYGLDSQRSPSGMY